MEFNMVTKEDITDHVLWHKQYKTANNYIN